MKKIGLFAMALCICVSVLFAFPLSAAAEGNLIQNMQFSLKETESPQRLEIAFTLKEPIDLSQPDANIIYEYFTKDSDGSFVSTGYIKNKMWSGYLNTYDNYPADEHKYSSGAENNLAYADTVPAADVYTSVKTSASIDVADVAAVRVTVQRADGSGEAAFVYSDGTVSAVQSIEVPVTHTDAGTGIMLAASTAQLPAGTVLKADVLTSGPVYDHISDTLSHAANLVIFNLQLSAGGDIIQPDGGVLISVPVPAGFNLSKLVIYRVEANGTTTLHPVAVEVKGGKTYATFETEHFSNYALADEAVPVVQTGVRTTVVIALAMIAAAVGLVLLGAVAISRRGGRRDARHHTPVAP